MHKKVVVLNVSGNVGKTTISSQLLYPRMRDASGKFPTLVEVETYNKSAAGLPGITAIQKTGSQYRDVYELAYEDPALIVDVGASNIVPFFEQLTTYRGSAEVFDMFIVPTTPGSKEMHDTLKTIQLLRMFGVGDDRLRVVFTRVASDVVDEFKLLYNASATDTHSFNFDKNLTIFETELFKELGELGETVDSLLSDDSDYPTLIRAAETPQDKKRLVKRDMALRMARSVNDNLDFVFSHLALQVAEKPTVKPVKK
ncbi:StbB family protein [Methylovorus glucosotrophus]|uniref:Uncharacterized protein n=1 Tax=Methylovorus glucosotrophus (strain SIP3-4) TaxID=582744 RepID=C6XEM0_METGS|nr:StbB family protein [Methylovorus glucosotrophus]ACT52077.1 conserved hypothetical protein [Methylovorus glucosotrophus SIP3-4]